MLIEHPGPAAFLLWHIVATLVSFSLYGFDKRRSVRGGRRVRESRLHLVDALGGWPGGLVAMRVFKHKRRKQAFTRVFAMTVFVHLAALALLLRLVR
ncbi:MAG: DUF1294 domain-containing protein [Planctomycetes bacterium]|nr:DUF1294 domain-containing protein [Planctomycetota bacterium]